MAKYRFGGGKNERVDRLVVEGSSVNPKRFVDVGEEIELSDEEAERFRKTFKLTKVDGSESTAAEQSEPAPGGETPGRRGR